MKFDTNLLLINNFQAVDIIFAVLEKGKERVGEGEIKRKRFRYCYYCCLLLVFVVMLNNYIYRCYHYMNFDGFTYDDHSIITQILPIIATLSAIL